MVVAPNQGHLSPGLHQTKTFPPCSHPSQLALGGGKTK